MPQYDARIVFVFGRKDMKDVSDDFPVRELAKDLARLTEAAVPWTSPFSAFPQRFYIVDSSVVDGMINITLDAKAATNAAQLVAFEKRMDELSLAILPFADPEEIIRTDVYITISRIQAI